MKRIGHLLFLFGLLGWATSAWAQQLTQQTRYLTVNEGLLHTDATTLGKDRQGFFWIGSYGGLNRFDGYELKPYINATDKLQRVYQNRINRLLVDTTRSVIWLATQGGLTLFDLQREQYVSFTVPSISLAKRLHKTFTYLQTDRSGNLWLALPDGLCVVRYNAQTQTLTEVKTVGAILTEEIDGMTTDAGGNVWFINQRGIFRTTLGRSVQRVAVLDEQQREHSEFSGLLFDRQGHLVLGASNGLMIVGAGQAPGQPWKGRFYVVASGTLTNTGDQAVTFNALAESPKGGYFLGSPFGLIQATPQGNQLAIQTMPRSAETLFFSNHISQLYADPVASTLWVATFGGGVRYYNLTPKPFFLIQQRPSGNSVAGPSGSYIRALKEDRNGNLWIGTRTSGLELYSPTTGTTRTYMHQPGSTAGPISNNIRSITEDRQGHIWIGTDAGISVLTESSRFEALQHRPNDPNSLSDNVIFSMDVDAFGQVWAGSWNKGLNRIRSLGSGRYGVLRLANGTMGTSGDKITFIHADPQRPEVFVGTTQGLDHFFLNSAGDVSRVQHYKATRHANSLTSDFIWPIVRQDARTLWVGTIGGGLNRLTLLPGGKYVSKSYTTQQGLPSNDVESLELDPHGNLWIGGRGLTLLKPETDEITTFDVHDGLQSNVFKIGASERGRDGRLYFGGINGINYFYPDSISRSQRSVSPALSELLVNNRLVSTGDKIESDVVLQQAISMLEPLTLNYLQNNFSLRFSGLNVVNPEKCLYRYRLRGFDKDWITIDARQRTASYSNLDYGEYTFELLASNEDGRWTVQPLQLKVVVTPPWWKSTWAKLVYALLILSVLIGGYIYQIRWFTLKRKLEIKSLEEQQKEELHQMRMQFFTNISHELRTPLTLILSPIEKLLHGGVEGSSVTHYYQLIHRNTNRLLHLVNELLEFRKAESGAMQLQTSETRLGMLVREVCNEFVELALQKDIDFQVLLPANEQVLWLDRGIVEKSLVNLLSNAFKYTDPGGRIVVEITTADQPHFANAYRIQSRETADAERCWIRVADTGRGLGQVAIEQIFDRFYRVTDKASEQPGVGIGLAFVKSLMMVHQGAISVFSEEGKGTEFYLGFPTGNTYLQAHEISRPMDYMLDDAKIKAIEVTQELGENRPKLVPRNSEGYKPKLLVVEDNAELRQFLVDSFGSTYQVLEAADGAMGLEMAQDELPDIIISDVMMPKMDGFAFCQAVKNTLEISHTPVVLLTAKVSVESRIQGTESGADAYIPKPFSLRLLELTLHNLLDSRRKLKELYAHDVFVEAREMVTTKKDKEFVDQLIGIIEQHLDDTEFEVENLCREMGISRTKLYNKINSLMGQSVGELIRKLRLKKAAQLIVSEDISIMEVMERVGIQSQSYFTKAFKKEFGKTPTQYLHDFLVDAQLTDALKQEELG